MTVQDREQGIHAMGEEPSRVLSLPMATPRTTAEVAALAVARTTADALRARVVTGRADGWADREAEAVLEDALAASAALVAAVPALAERHTLWAQRFARTGRETVTRRALGAANHLGQLARAGGWDVIVTDPGARFAEDLDLGIDGGGGAVRG